MYWQGIGISWLRNGSSQPGCAARNAGTTGHNMQRLGTASLLALSLAIGSVSAQETRPAAAAIERDIATLTQQIASKQQQIATLRNRPSPEQSELNNAQKRLAEARAAFQASGSAENESRAKNAEFKLKLAEIKYNKAHPDVDVLVDEVEQLQSQLAVRQREAKEPRETRATADAGDRPAAPKAVESQASLAKARQQEQELARSRQEAEAQQKEIDRLKAALAAKETKETAVHAAVPVAVAPAVVAAVAAPAAVAKPAEPTAPAKPATIGGGAMKLISAQEVAQELQQLAQRLAAPGPERGTNDALYLKRPDTKVTNKDKVILRALGKEQYRGQTQVDAGSYQISVGFNQWPLEFNATEAGPTTFLYDNSDPQKARLLIYNSALEAAK